MAEDVCPNDGVNWTCEHIHGVRPPVRCEGCGRPISHVAYTVSIPGRVLKLHDHPCLRSWIMEHACPCGCHDAIQPGLVPCPECEHSSRTARPSGPGVS